MRLLMFLLVFASMNWVAPASRAPQTLPGSRLEDMPWVDAERVLTADAVVVIPLGAGSAEHGPHLTLGTDLTLAGYLTDRVTHAANVVVAPPLTYHYYPAFLDYPGSTSLSLNTARDATIDIVRSLARFGPRRFYVLNAALSPGPALEAAAKGLAAEGILLRYTQFDEMLDDVARGIRRQERGGHAGELETSMMLYIEPAAVDMRRAARELGIASAPFRLSRRPDGGGTLSRTGIWGDATTATGEKGRALVDAMVPAILTEISALRRATLPAALASPAAAANAAAVQPIPVPQRPPIPDRCSAGDERAIRGIGDAFASYWANADAESIGDLWSSDGDIVHPDGSIERGATVIRQNRAQLFARKEYRNTRHPLRIGRIRCLSADVAVADATWELRGVTDASGQPMPTMEGLATLVVKRTSGSWSIEAYRYTTRTPATRSTVR